MANFDRKLRRSEHYVGNKVGPIIQEPQKPPGGRTEPFAVIDPTLWDTSDGQLKLLQTFAILGMIFKLNQEAK